MSGPEPASAELIAGATITLRRDRKRPVGGRACSGSNTGGVAIFTCTPGVSARPPFLFHA